MHEVELVVWAIDGPGLYHCKSCGKCANGERGRELLEREVCTGRKTVN
jgi:hypothetical protein